VFCGTFEAKGAQLDLDGGRMTVRRPGRIRKFVDAVDHVTFSGAKAHLVDRSAQVLKHLARRALPACRNSLGWGEMS
jgi:acyl CoA:acetate/3-ketoacid CoA transferase